VGTNIWSLNVGLINSGVYLLIFCILLGIVWGVVMWHLMRVDDERKCVENERWEKLKTEKEDGKCVGF